ncbi:MAG: hypothetical protein V9G98_12280 [Candidatus Competibacter sp.]
MVETPLRDRQIDFQFAGRFRWRLQVAMVVRHQQSCLDPEAGLDTTLADFDHLLGDQRPGQLARHLVKESGPLFAGVGHPSLIAESGGELADDQPHDQHHRKGQDRLPRVEHECEARRHEDEIERQYVEDGHQDRRTTSVPCCHAHHCQQKQHDDVGVIEIGQQWHGRQRDA